MSYLVFMWMHFLLYLCAYWDFDCIKVVIHLLYCLMDQRVGLRVGLVIVETMYFGH